MRCNLQDRVLDDINPYAVFCDLLGDRVSQSVRGGQTAALVFCDGCLGVVEHLQCTCDCKQINVL